MKNLKVCKLTLAEFRRETADLPGEAVIMIERVGDPNLLYTGDVQAYTGDTISWEDDEHPHEDAVVIILSEE